MPYHPDLVKPFRDELTAVGFTELKTAGDVDATLRDRPGTALVVVNSVCGCAAGCARPGVALSLGNAKKPGLLATVFAGVDLDATARARELFPGVRPSSPSMALLKDGKLVWMLERHQIEGRSPEQVAAQLSAAFDAHC